MNPLVSILIPVYNAAPFLRECLDSACRQTYQDIEVLCCDDGSQDDSPRLLQDYSQSDHRIRVFAQESNAGVVATRNLLLSKARGEYIAWLDADDILASEKIERQLAFLRTHATCGAVGTGVKFFTEDGRSLRTESYPDDPVSQRDDPKLCCATVLVRRGAAQSAGLFRPLFQRGGEDGDWLLRIADHWELRNVPDPLYFYRVREGSVSKSSRAKIRRLGVIARAAARNRRRFGTCPIDSGLLLNGHPEEILNSKLLSAREKVLALSLFDPDHPPLVTVAIPFYRADEFIDDCLESLLRQSFQNFEVVLYDDGSVPPFDSGKLRMGGGFGADRFRLFRGEENRGAAFARNRILEKARGRYIAFQDADDTSETDRFWRLLEDLLGDPALAAVGSAIEFVDHKGKLLRSEAYPREAISEGGFNGCCGTFMYDKSRAPDLLFDEAMRSASEDVDFLLRLGDVGKIHNNRDLLYRYRVHSHSLTAQSDWLQAHTRYMWARFARRRGVFGEAGLSPEALIDLILAADGTQTAELLLTRVYRQWLEKQISLRRFLAIVRLFPRTSFHILHQHWLLAIQSRWRVVRKALVFGCALSLRIAAALVVRPARRLQHGLLSLIPPPRNPLGVDVRILSNWGDEQEALDLLLPGRCGCWGSVQFSTRGRWFRRPDYVVVLNQPSKPISLRMSPNRVWFAIGEPPTEAHKPLHLAQGTGTVVFTPAKYPSMHGGEVSRIYEPSHTMTRTWWVKKTFEELNSMDTVPKSRMLSWVTSDIALLRGHRERLAFLKRCREALEFDLFGKGFQPIDDKWPALAPYYFSIAYENVRASGYFTEKLMDCLVSLTVPLYVGACDIHDYFPKESIIVIDPEDPDVFDIIKSALNESNYQRRLPALREAKHLVVNQYNMFIHLANAIVNDRRPPKRPAKIRLKPVSLDWSLSQ